MSPILLIIRREYLVRVTKKSFLMVTFLVPLLVAAMYGLIGYLIFNQNSLGTAKKVVVVDSTGHFQPKFKNTPTIVFLPARFTSLEKAKKEYKKLGGDFILSISPVTNVALAAMGGSTLDDHSIQLVGDKEASVKIVNDLEDQLDQILKTERYLAAGIDTAKINQVKANVHINTSVLTEEGEKKSNSFSSYGIGFFSAFIIYLFIFMYGVQVMRGVLEEKTSRIVEVIISSVKPFELMLGKIVGVAAVGLTQLLLWVTLSAVLVPVASSYFSSPHVKAPIQAVTPAKTIGAHTGSKVLAPTQQPIQAVFEALQTLDYPYIIGCFLFYFLSGYLLYSALFAAVGAAVDSETETQQFMFPITLPLVFAFIISTNYVVNNPDSTLSVWLSMVPFFSPVVMMVRVPFHPPLWQLALSMVLMVLGFLGTVWLAGKIYRTGILMYGKKISFAELGRWLFYKG